MLLFNEEKNGLTIIHSWLWFHPFRQGIFVDLWTKHVVYIKIFVNFHSLVGGCTILLFYLHNLLVKIHTFDEKIISNNK